MCYMLLIIRTDCCFLFSTTVCNSASDNDSDGAEQRDDWDADEGEEEEVIAPTKCLLCPEQLPTSDEALAHCVGMCS